jgi:Protein of unknwon function (DUF3310)
VSKAEKVRQLLHTGLSVKEIVKRLKVKPSYVYTQRWQMKHEKIKKDKPIAWLNSKKLLEQRIEDKQPSQDSHDRVNSPLHYRFGGIETIDFIEAKKLGYHLGNVVKYVSRADYKDNRLEDLKKAQWYLNRAIENAEADRGTV